MKRELKKIRSTIAKNAVVRDMTSRIFWDENMSTTVASLVNAIRNADEKITAVKIWDREDEEIHDGWRWKDGKLKDKCHEILIETTEGNISGSLVCFGCGTVKDPISAYDINLDIWG